MNLIEQHFNNEYRTLYKRVSRRAGGPYNAEDVVQEAFARALKYLPAFNPEKKEFGAWFNTILNNALHDFKREEMTYGMCLEFDEELIDGEPMSQTDKGLIEKIHQLMDEKPEHIAELLHLSFDFGYKPSEIAEITDSTSGVVRVTIARFKDEVREKLGSSGDRIRL